MVTITTTNSFRLSDGRELGYGDYGDPNGRPVLFFHGTPGSRLSGLLPGVVAGSLHARVIAPDRPGYGLSQWQPGRELLDWPADVRELADGLGLDRFAVLGFSGGAPYALACALRMPERLTNVGIVSGMGPLDNPGARAPFTVFQRLRFAGARLLPRLVRPAVWFSTRGVRANPERFFAAWAAQVADDDRAILERPAIRSVVHDDRVEALRQGVRGIARELTLLVRPWGFALEDVPCPVDLWHGEADTVVPVELARVTARRLPRVNSRFLPGRGHLLFVDEMDEILRAMLGD